MFMKALRYYGELFEFLVPSMLFPSFTPHSQNCIQLNKVYVDVVAALDESKAA